MIVTTIELGGYYFLYILLFLFILNIVYFHKKTGLSSYLVAAIICLVIKVIVMFLYEVFCPKIISALLEVFYLDFTLWIIFFWILMPWYIAKEFFSD